MRLGDYVLYVNIALNVAAAGFYAYEGHWRNVGYWVAVMQLNFWLTRLR